MNTCLVNKQIEKHNILGFTFKQFHIEQERCAMKVGTDGVLIGAWANGGKRILDIGTGTGLIALMMAQRFDDAEIKAVDLDHDACCQARENVANSRFAGRVEVFETAIQQFHDAAGFDSIVSNPPFFQNSLKNPDTRRAAARHSDSLPFSVLFEKVAALLTSDGVFSAVIPTECVSAFIAEGSLHGLSVVRRCDVRTTPRKAPRRSLLAFSRRTGGEMERTEVVLQETNGQRSEWYDALTHDFYIR